jgi:hypothetical protein
VTSLPAFDPDHALLDAPEAPAAPPRPGPPLVQVRELAGRLLATLAPADVAVERRRELRIPFPRLVYLTPVADDRHASCGPAQVAAGKHLSRSGLGVYHPEPILQRLVVASFEPTDAQGWISLLLELRWCRFIRHGWYESGGRFVAPVPTPWAAIRTCCAPRSPWR